MSDKGGKAYIFQPIKEKMKINMKTGILLPVLCLTSILSFSQGSSDPSLLTMDRIFNSREFAQEYPAPVHWIDHGDAYVIAEYSGRGEVELVKYECATNLKTTLVSSSELIPAGSNYPILVEDFSFTPDGTKVLLFSNSARVWRSNTKGDYWVFDLKEKSLKQIGKSFPGSSLMFAKFTSDNRYVAYVHEFNIYTEDLLNGNTAQLTFGGNGHIINGTFDWVYEEEFGCRDGFKWSPNGSSIAFWNLDASEIGTFYLMNNTDSVYSKVIPIQYPKVGQNPSACKVGIMGISNKQIDWVPLPGDVNQNYIPGMQWVNDSIILLQQINRKQNHYKIWSYNCYSKVLDQLYDEVEDTWIDIRNPDITSDHWQENDLPLVDNNTAFLRTTDTGGWRQIFKIDVHSGKKTLLTPGEYDVASYYSASEQHVFFGASPGNSTQRYLYRANLDGTGNLTRLTPDDSPGINTYNCSPNGKFGIHANIGALSPYTARVIRLSDHKALTTLVDNYNFKEKISTLKLPEVRFFTVTTEEGIEMDGRIIFPVGFDSTERYPVLFHGYSEPWSQTAVDSWIGMWNIYLAQNGFIIIDMDNRGTPCLKGKEWRKSIYRKMGLINTRDQALAAKKVLKWNFVDKDRVSVWGWSGGGTMTLNLMFQYPEVYKTGISVAPVPYQLLYDNIYQERYMGLPRENEEDFIAGSPITYAKNLQGNLLIIHGTGDDNVHYQGTEMLINELIKENKQFQMMAYPNRTHGIYEGRNTTRHLYTLLTNFLLEHNSGE
jgi:dipeptidyl-peptidase-4